MDIDPTYEYQSYENNNKFWQESQWPRHAIYK